MKQHVDLQSGNVTSLTTSHHHLCRNSYPHHFFGNSYPRSVCVSAPLMVDMSNLLVLSAKEVDSIVSHFQPKDLQLLMAQQFQLSAHPKAPTSIPHRLSVPMPNHTALFMPARIGGGGSTLSPGQNGNTAIKVVCVPHDSCRSSTGGLAATTMVLDENTGGVKAIVNARKLTALRNAAGPCYVLHTFLFG
jgi:ornithine cyclodeaminase/alanine dehydrogenase-like protein (mu-crystallin family)